MKSELMAIINKETNLTDDIRRKFVGDASSTKRYQEDGYTFAEYETDAVVYIEGVAENLNRDTPIFVPLSKLSDEVLETLENLEYKKSPYPLTLDEHG
ncbi:hypothetical protein [Limosilactobacillus equigenerosi]|uniref:hypothetical protein n=1 Tax=Limosilactobacillus equigenerosi TaxID=417373 RepID=UPI0006D1C408|nr:hypothetical protein [Limosilactobacillus equigenerosi]